jgi:lipoyl(octanoyl) transferase
LEPAQSNLRKAVEVVELPRSAYRDVLALQRTIHDEVARGVRPGTWIVVEHEPVVTLGRRADRSNLLLSPEMLAARGVDLVEVERGGDATYHGPGQLVIYPIMRLERFREVVPLVSALEASVVRMLAGFGIAATGRSEHRGVYAGDAAICAIGLAVKRMTSMHGLALNVSTRLDYDELIVPCGMPAFGITSMSHELGRRVSLEAARGALLSSLCETLEVQIDASVAQRIA